MPGWGEGPSTSADDLDEAASSLPVDQGTRLGEEFGHGDVGQGAAGFGAAMLRRGAAAIGLQPEEMMGSEDANEQFGVPGYLRFNGPVNPRDAAFQQHMALERQFRAEVLSRSNPNALTDIGAGLTGAIADPGNFTLAAVTGGLGDATLGALGLGESATEGGAGITALGRLAGVARGVPRALAVGGIENAPFVAAGAAAQSYEGGDYDAGDALRDLTAGAILHTTLHAAFGTASALMGGKEARTAPLAAEAPTLAAEPAEGPQALPGLGGEPFAREAAPARDYFGTTALSRDMDPARRAVPWTPPEVDQLPPAARLGAWAKALDDAGNDRPVDVGELIQRELTPPGLDRLNEGEAEPAIPSWRPGAEDTAVTTRGAEIPVRYGLAELGELTTSHTDDLQTNPAYPAELQPRERGRAGAQARNLQLEAELNPKLLMSDVGAGQGAPIVAPDGVVESGNGRTIALRRAAAKNSPAWQAYQAELKARGFATDGMQAPVLVRMRTEPLTGAQRSGLAAEMNADVTERMGPTEQAMADARALPDQAFDLIEENRGPTTSRAFARAFIERAAPDQVGQMTDADGRLSPEGVRRIRAAVLAKAYGDPQLVAQLHEGSDTAGGRIGEALAEAAPAWAKLRSLVARGEAAASLDVTDALTSAMDLVRFAKRENQKLGDLIADRLGQTDIFGGDMLSPTTEAFLRLFYRDETFTRTLAADKISAALADYARQAGAIPPGEDLFGEAANESTARQILRTAQERYAAGPDAARLATVRPPGPVLADNGLADAEPAVAPVVDLREPGQERGGPAGARGVPREGEPGAEPEGGRAGGAASGNEPGNAGSRAAGVIAADPELKALAADTERLAQTHSVEEPAAEPKADPANLAEAIRAAAVCLTEEL